MNFCHNAKPEQIIKTIKKIDHVFPGIKPSEYLFLLDNSDMTPCCFYSKSLYDIIDHNRKFLSGNLQIMDFNDYVKDENNIKYRIGGELTKYVLYKKLPKDEIYVPENEYSMRNFTSMYNEFIHILSILNIKSIKINIVNEDKCKVLCNLYSESSIDELHNKMKIDSNTNYSDKRHTAKKIMELLDEDKKNLYYYHIKEDWKNIIERRLNGQNDGKYNTELVESQEMGTKITSYIELGIEVKCMNKIVYEYEFEYYPLLPEVEKIYQIQIKKKRLCGVF
jgi:hypothetical protein